jgi:hypothetical protein
MHTDFVSPSDSRWNEALCALGHDTYDLPEYVAVCARYEESAPFAFYAREGDQFALIPLLQRPLPSSLGAPPSWSDATSPYGYSSALFTGGAEWSFRVVNAFVEACAGHQIISVFVRLHPLLPSVPALGSAGKRVWHGETVYVDLTVPEGEMRRQMRNNYRREIRRLHFRDFKVVVDDWSLYDRFIQIYWETMWRLDADPYYFFSNDYFQDLRQALGSHLHLFSVLSPDCSVAAAGLFTETEGIVEFHLSSTAQEYRHLAPAKLMLDCAINWAKAAGNRVLHLGGGVGSRKDSLFQFKAGFSNLRSDFETWQVICDQKRYDELTEHAGLCSALIHRFFPAYRASSKLVETQ